MRTCKENVDVMTIQSDINLIDYIACFLAISFVLRRLVANTVSLVIRKLIFGFRLRVLQG